MSEPRRKKTEGPAESQSTVNKILRRIDPDELEVCYVQGSLSIVVGAQDKNRNVIFKTKVDVDIPILDQYSVEEIIAKFEDLKSQFISEVREKVRADNIKASKT